ncbi:MAG: hypothetical protein MJZ04_04005 [Bacteroidales bacterium]|nr:hypothetical protein [Bacteroidales bacterium]
MAARIRKYFLFAIIVISSCDRVGENEKLVKQAAQLFVSSYETNWVAPYSYVREVFSNGRYCYFQGIQGVADIHFDVGHAKDYGTSLLDANFYTSDALVTDLYSPQSLKPVLKPESGSVYPATLHSLASSYHNSTCIEVWRQKSSIELYSPLSPSHVKEYDYIVEHVGEGPSKHIEVTFLSKAGFFPKRNKICGQGKLYLTAGYMPFRIELNNSENRTYSAAKGPARPIATPYHTIVDYVCRKGKIYISSISSFVRWEMPDVSEDEQLFIVESPSCRNPFKNGLTSETVLRFGEPYGNQTLPESIGSKYIWGKQVSLYSDSVDLSFWRDSFPDKFSKLLEDVGLTEEQLVERSLQISEEFRQAMLRNGIDVETSLHETRYYIESTK